MPIQAIEQTSACNSSGASGVICAPPKSNLVQWIDGDFKSEDSIGDKIKMVDNETSEMSTQDFL
jgi:hypothetical protein